MKCIRPLQASQNCEGDIVYSSKQSIPGLIGFEFECRKCLPCRLNQAREKAVRSFHEAQMHKENIFLTLTYNEESLNSPKLKYRDYQLFIKTLREHNTRKHITAQSLLDEGEGKSTQAELDKKAKDLINKTKITYMVTGEYGEKNKRPHWHAILFNFSPTDTVHLRTTERGDEVFTSDHLTKIWGKGNIEFGSVTIDSANYVARYAAKKLVHGYDQDHDFHPIHKTSSRYGIGRTWIEKYWPQTFGNGFIYLPNGQESKIPRYYVDWFKKHHPEKYIDYVINVREKIQKKAEAKANKEELNHIASIMEYKGGAKYPTSRNGIKKRILDKKFKHLQEYLKL